jgi:hypothetical protein
MTASDDRIVPGSVWRQVKLGTAAVYEVLLAHAETVEVIVREAPGLAPGTRLRLSRAALEAMEPCADGHVRER